MRDAYLRMGGIENDRYSGYVAAIIADWRMELEVGSG